MYRLMILQALLFYGTIIISISSAQAEVINIGELSREGAEAEVFPVEVTSGTPEIRMLAKTAFASHGGFQVVPASKGLFVFRFDQLSPEEVKISIKSGFPRQIQYTEIIKEKNWEDATLKACDLVVENTVGTPGFFSGKLAFIGEREESCEVYMGDLFFNHVKQITHDKSKVLSPRWSPDGGKLLFTSYFNTGFPDIFIYDTTSGHTKAFANYEGTNTGAVFSPNGQQVAMILSSSGNPELYISDISGKVPKRLTSNKSLEASPSWSTDGKRIFVTSDQLGGPQIYEIDPTPGGQMTRIPINVSRYCSEPVQNPLDPNILAFTTAVKGTFQIALYNFKSKQSKFLTQGHEDHLEPYWTNDGRHLIMTRRVGKLQELYLLDTLTGKQTRLHSPDFGYASMGCFVNPEAR